MKLASPGANAGGANYRGELVVGTSGNTTGSPVRIDGSNAQHATLDGNGGSSIGCSTSSCNGPVLTVTNGMHLVLKDLTIQNGDNQANGLGGGLQNDNGGNVRIVNTTFTNNTASAGQSDGGAIDNADKAGQGRSRSTTRRSAATPRATAGRSTPATTVVTVCCSCPPRRLCPVTAPRRSRRDATAGRARCLPAGNVFAGSCQENGGTWTDAGFNVNDDPTSDVTCLNNAPGDVDVGSAQALHLTGLANRGGQEQTIAIGGQSAAEGIMADPTTVTLNGQQVTLCGSPATDQRGAPRPEANVVGCDAGAYETEPAAPAQPDITTPANGASYAEDHKSWPPIPAPRARPARG